MPSFSRVRRRASHALLIGVLAGTACTESLLPESVGGTYTLVAVNGLAPPQAISENVTVLGDTIAITAGGRGTRVSWNLSAPSSGVAQAPRRTETRVAIVRQGGNLWLDERLAVDNCDCLTSDLGRTLLTVVGDDLYLGTPPHLRLLRRVAP